MGDDIYVSYSYNLRRFIIKVDIPEIDYMLNMNMNPLKYLHDVEISAGIAT
jgi:pyoverdine/dityrosine biosynthesis protein Dit1